MSTFNDKTILVCGGAGFIGSNFIHYILENYPKVKLVNLDKLTYSGNLDNLKDVSRDRRYKFIKGDIANEKVIAKVFKKYAPDYVINLAAETHVDRSIHVGALQFIKTNVQGVFNILEAVKQDKNVIKYLQVSCYDKSTRAWTKEGLKNYRDLKVGDEVLTLNPKTRETEVQKIEKVIVQPYQGDMVTFDNGKIDLMVTPNHRMLQDDFTFARADTLKHLSLPHAENHDKQGDEKTQYEIPNFGTVATNDLFYLTGIFLGDGFTAYQEKIVPNLSGMKRSEYMVCGRGNDGKFHKVLELDRGVAISTICRSYRIFFDVPEADKARKRLEQTLTSMGISFSKQSGKSGQHVYLTSKALFEFFDQHCIQGADKKHIPDFVWSYSQSALESLFEGLIDSDGYWRPNGVALFTTISESLKNNMVELACRLGRNVSVRRTFSSSNFKGRVIEGEAYQVLIGNGFGKQSLKKNSIIRTPYNADVWCIKVKNKNFLVERNGKYAFCGNTDEVYGTLTLDSKEKFRENTAFDPNVPYAATKAGGDLLCNAYHTTWKVPVVVTHCSNNYGPYQYPEKLIPFFTVRLLEGKKLPLYGDGKNVRDWIYVIDHCRALELVLLRGVSGEVYNIGADNEMSNLQIAGMIAKQFGRGAECFEFVPDRPGHDRRYAIDSTKIEEELGWKPEYSFETAFRETVEWYKNNLAWVKNIQKKTGVFNPHIDLWKSHNIKNKIKK